MSLLQYFTQDPLNLGIKYLNVTMLEPLAFASKTLMLTSQCYANTKQEILSVVSGLEKFQHYRFGRHTLVLSDQKPLASIMGKDMSNVPPRLQWMLLRLQHFSFEIHYREGNDIMFIYHLSRNLVDSPESNERAPGLDHVCIATISKELNISHPRLERVCEATAHDLNMQALIHVIISRMAWHHGRDHQPNVWENIGPTVMSCLC